MRRENVDEFLVWGEKDFAVAASFLKDKHELVGGADRFHHGDGASRHRGKRKMAAEIIVSFVLPCTGEIRFETLARISGPNDLPPGFAGSQHAANRLTPREWDFDLCHDSGREMSLPRSQGQEGSIDPWCQAVF